MKKIDVSDVPTANWAGIPSTLINNGTITKPPPTPRIEETNPPSKPIRIGPRGEKVVVLLISAFLLASNSIDIEKYPKRRIYNREIAVSSSPSLVR